MGCCGSSGTGLKFVCVCTSDPAPSSFTFAVSVHTLGVVPKHSGWWLEEQAHGCFDMVIAANQSRVIHRNFTLEFGVAFTWKLRGESSSHLARTDCDDMNSTPPSKNDELASERGTGLIHKCGGFSYFCANHKWLVVHDDIKRELCVSNLLMEPIKSVQFPTGTNRDVFMNQCNEDEAVLAQNVGDTTLELSVVNLSEVWSTGAITPVFCTEYFLPFEYQTQFFLVDRVLILQTESGGRAFVVRSNSWSRAMILKFPDASCPDKVHMVMYNNERSILSQMSERLYCLTRSPNTMEIWDCNNPTNPMRVVDHNFCCRLVCAHSGFLFHIGRRRIIVTDYNSGFKPDFNDLGISCTEGRDRVSPATTVASQFLALLMLSHPRCGCVNCGRNNPPPTAPAPHPSSVLENVALALRTVWEWIMGCCGSSGTSLKLVCVCTSDPAPSSFTFAVSVHTLGVVPKHSGWWLAEQAHEGIETIVAANQSRVIHRNFTHEFGVAFTWKLREESSSHLARTDCDDMNSTPPSKNDELASARRTGLIHKCGGFSSDCANHKWLVVYDYIKRELCVSNLLMEPPATKSVQFPTGTNRDVFMNQCNEDEAVLAQKYAEDTNTLELSVVNLSEVWSTGAITPVFCTKYFLPFDSQTQFFSVDSVLILQTESGGRAFVVCSCPWSHTMILKFPDESRPDKVHMVRYNDEKVTLSQMSERLYCLTRSPNTMEIWDCNNPTNPMRPD
ncbi:hypothetical protein Pelo_7858 [Pelomyxa schiedti]|nr:hypothetical protein Pelo_7858 [Pelomyxa schiedti]